MGTPISAASYSSSILESVRREAFAVPQLRSASRKKVESLGK
jgi:hypothetical protein